MFGFRDVRASAGRPYGIAAEHSSIARGKDPLALWERGLGVRCEAKRV